MKKITLQSLVITNFKGIKHLEISDFSEKETQIFGNNGLGKTSILDAFLWLLFGKDSADRKDFDIKYIDPNGVQSERTDVEVCGTLVIDGNVTTLRRALSEKWQKKRGSEVQEFNGNETKFFWNDVPFSLTEYNVAIKSNIDENLFKLLTNVQAFNAMEWKDRRKILFDIAGNSTDADIAESLPHTNKDIAEFVISVLNQQKTLLQYRSEVAEKKKKLKDELKQIGPRIDEVQKSRPEVTLTEAEINTTIASTKEKLARNAELIASENARLESANKEFNDKKQAINNEILAKKSEYQTLEHSLQLKANESIFADKQKLQDATNEAKQIESELSAKQKTKVDIQNQISTLDDKLTLARANFEAISNERFEYKETQSNCPTCKQALPSEVVDVTQLEANFNKNKLERLNKIQQAGIELKNEQSQLKEELATLLELIAEAETLLEAANENISKLQASTPVATTYDTSELDAITNDIEALSAQLQDLQPSILDTISIQNYKIQQDNYQKHINNLNLELALHADIKRANNRIQELLAQEKTMSEQLATLEKSEFLLDEFEAIKIRAVEEKIAGLFSYVRFKMFNKLINGGVEECCETTINGVPYSSANTASQINAGLDIINTLSNFYQIEAPCFVDRAESVTGFISFEKQIIKLIVSNDNALRIVKN